MRDEALEVSFCPDQGTKGELASNDDQIPPEPPAEYVSSEIADLIPWMSDAEFERLKEDIRLHGQKVPIQVRGNEIIDGRFRYLACKELGRRVEAIQVSGTDEELKKLSESLNDKRRHKSQAQLAAWVVDTTPDPPMGRPSKNSAAAADFPRKALAKKYGVSDRSVEQAAKVKREAPEIYAQVKSGEVSLERALSKIQAKRRTPKVKPTAPSGTGDTDGKDVGPPASTEDTSVKTPDSEGGVEATNKDERLWKTKNDLLVNLQFVIKLLPDEDKITFTELATKVCDFLDINLYRNAVIN